MDDGATPAFAAASNGHADVVRVLPELGASLETPMNDGRTPAFAAASGGHTEVIVELAKAQPHLVNQTVSWGGNPPTSLLAAAVSCAHLETVKALILLGAPVTAEDLVSEGGDGVGAPPLTATSLLTEAAHRRPR